MSSLNLTERYSRAKLAAMSQRFQERLALTLILFAAVSRLIPHPPNFTPLISIALFSGFVFQRKLRSLAIAFLAMLLTNIFLGFDSISWVVMAILAGMTAWGWRLKRGRTPRWWPFYALASSLSFFILSNFYVWIEGRLYPVTFQGFSACYLAAIPFFKNTLLSTLLYSLALFEGSRLLNALNAFFRGPRVPKSQHH